MVEDYSVRDNNSFLRELRGALLDLGEHFRIIRQSDSGFVVSTGMTFYDKAPVTLLVSSAGANMCVVSDDGLTRARLAKGDVPAQALRVRELFVGKYSNVHEDDNGVLFAPSSFKLLGIALRMMAGAVLTVDAACLVAECLLPVYATVLGE